MITQVTDSQLPQPIDKCIRKRSSKSGGAQWLISSIRSFTRSFVRSDSFKETHAGQDVTSRSVCLSWVERRKWHNHLGWMKWRATMELTKCQMKRQQLRMQIFAVYSWVEGVGGYKRITFCFTTNDGGWLLLLILLWGGGCWWWHSTTGTGNCAVIMRFGRPSNFISTDTRWHNKSTHPRDYYSPKHIE